MDRKVERTGEVKGLGEATWFSDFMFFGEWREFSGTKATFHRAEKFSRGLG